MSRVKTSATQPQIVGIVVLHNEDVFVERAIRNVVDFCDRIHVFDHLSNDKTPEIIRSLAREFDHIELKRSRNAAHAQRLLERYLGTPTWVFAVDGDELYDPAGLAVLRGDLLAGAHADVFRVKAHVLNCDELDVEKATASGFMSPPSRPITKLFNFESVTSWTGCQDKLEGGNPVFRPGFDWESLRNLAETTEWDSDPLRLPHVCFLRRSSRDHDDGSQGRKNIAETQTHRRGISGSIYRLLRRPKPAPELLEAARKSGNWKREKLTRGPRVTVDARPFLGSLE